jgi:hypothetical protein
MITVITPTIRPEGLSIVETGLLRQTTDDFEWLIGSPFKPKVSMAKWVEDDFKGGVWTLNRIYNKLIKEAKGDVIVSIQDFTFFDADALQKFRYHIKNTCDVVSGVGDKYEQVYPRVSNKLWQDPRKKGSYALREVPFREIEGNFCAINKQLLEDIGGFDESMDEKFYGMDWYGVLERLSIAGYKFFIDETLESYSLQHGRVADWEDKNGIHGGYTKFAIEYSKNPRLKYL